MIILKWVIILVAIVYLGAATALFVWQRSILFPIPTTARTTPQAAGLPQAEENILSTADGEKVIVWHIAAQPGHRLVLYFPGNGDTLAGCAGRFRDITSDGTGLIALSYRGYAGSSGQPSEQGLLQDMEAVYAFAAARYEPARMVAWGFSLGSGVAVALAADHPVGALILEAPYTSIADVAASAYPLLPVRYLAKDPFRSDARIGRVKAPLLAMHGGRDNVIPIAFGERLFALANEPKRFVRFPQGGHNDLEGFGALDAARQFIATLKS
jgi:fermentation-respiration switch protein FrsA (DUF1100 family)